VEDARVDFLLGGKYRGLTPLIDQTVLEALQDRPDLETLSPLEAGVEVLIRCSLLKGIDPALPESWRSFADEISNLLSEVLTPDATVTDAAAVTFRVYELISGLMDLHAEFDSSTEVFDVRAVEMYQGRTRSASETPYESTAYRPAQPIFYRGQTHPNQVQLELAIKMLEELGKKIQAAEAPLSGNILRELVKGGAKIALRQTDFDAEGVSPGLILGNILEPILEKEGRPPFEEDFKPVDLIQQLRSKKTAEVAQAKVHYYDEWDYLINDYRLRWCTLREYTLKGESSELVTRIKKERANLITTVRRRFQRIRPAMLRRVKRLPAGDEIDLNSAIEAIIERKADLIPTDRIYQQRKRTVRDVATVFLLDLSASTRKAFEEESDPFMEAGTEKGFIRSTSSFPPPHVQIQKLREQSSTDNFKRVIDIEREALIVMAEALEGLGDEYAIYGFSSFGRDNVEFLVVKDFSDPYNEQVRSRIGALKPRTSTRMGPAVRHAQTKLIQTGCLLKVLILLSDGYPQDYDYGPERMDHVYGVHDTKVALMEARSKNIHPFMVTVDLAGNDYLYDMCAGHNYLVVNRPSELPDVLPKVYRGLTV
jgi:hypothetical protein